MSSSFTDVFGGTSIQPAQVGLATFTMTANKTLAWPSADQDTSDAIGVINEVTVNAAGLTLTLPPANQVSPGTSVLVKNVGAFSLLVAGNGGSVIATVASGTAYYIWLLTNATAAGTWDSVQFGAGTSAANASALAGNGLTTSGSMLETTWNPTTLNANYTMVAGDRAKMFVWTGGAGTISLPAVATMGDGGFFGINNQGTGTVTLDPDGSEQFDGATTRDVAPGESLIGVARSTAWNSLGFGRSVNFTVTQLNKSVSGNSNVTLTSAEAGNLIQNYFGTLTGNISVIVPATVAEYLTYNNTAGAFTLTVQTASGTGVTLTQGQRYLLLCDGTNVVNGITALAAGNITFASGTANAPSITFASESGKGFWGAGSGLLGLAIGGERVMWSTTSQAMSIVMMGVQGSAGAPSYTFSGRTTDGIYSPASRQVGVTLSGSQVLNISQTDITFLGTSLVGQNSVPSYQVVAWAAFN